MLLNCKLVFSFCISILSRKDNHIYIHCNFSFPFSFFISITFVFTIILSEENTHKIITHFSKMIKKKKSLLIRICLNVLLILFSYAKSLATNDRSKIKWKTWHDNKRNDTVIFLIFIYIRFHIYISITCQFIYDNT